MRRRSSMSPLTVTVEVESASDARESGRPIWVRIRGRGWRSTGRVVRPRRRAAAGRLRMPTALYSPSYGDPGKTQAHRTFQTIQGLGGRLGVAIQSPLGEGQESALADAILAGGGEVVLICWEQHHIPALAEAIPTLDRCRPLDFNRGTSGSSSDSLWRAGPAPTPCSGRAGSGRPNGWNRCSSST